MKIKIEMSSFEKEVFSRLSNNSKKTYIVGGSVRDTIIGWPKNDIDIVTNLLPDDVFELFSDFYINPKGKFFGTVEVVYGNESVEVSTLKKRVLLTEPITIEFGDSIYDDAIYRDFTINTLYVDSNWELHDPLGGLDDLKNKLLVPVPTFRDRMIMDPIVVFRTARFIAQGYNPSEKLIDLLSDPNNHKHIRFPTPARLAAETRKALKYDFKKYLEFLHRTNALYYQFTVLEKYKSIVERAVNSDSPLEILAKNAREVLDTLYVPPNEYMKYLMKERATLRGLLMRY